MRTGTCDFVIGNRLTPESQGEHSRMRLKTSIKAAAGLVLAAILSQCPPPDNPYDNPENIALSIINGPDSIQVNQPCTLSVGIELPYLVNQVHVQFGESGGDTAIAPHDVANKTRDTLRIAWTFPQAGSQAIRIRATPHDTRYRDKVDSLTIVVLAEMNYAVAYFGNGHQSGTVPVDSSHYRPGQKAAVADNSGNMTREGFSFRGWNSAPDGGGVSLSPGDSITIDSSIALYAVWSEQQAFTITFDPNGAPGQAPANDSANQEGEAVILPGPGSLARENFAFVGWNDSPDGTGDSYAGGAQFRMPGSDITLYAQWASVPTHSIIYDANGGQGVVPTDANAYAEGAAAIVAAKGGLAREGHTFVGWNSEQDGSGEGYVAGEQFSMPARDVVLYAMWTQKPTYTVAYLSNGGSGRPPVDGNAYEEGASVHLADAGELRRDSYTFVGWNTAQDGSGDSYASNAVFTMPSEDVTLYARWTQNSTYAVSYDANAGTGAPTDNNVYEEGATVTIAGAQGVSRDGYAFVEWNTSQDGGGDAYSPGSELKMPAGDVTLYATWRLIPTHQITYDANGGDGASPSDTNAYEQGDSLSLADQGALNRDGYTFVGWNTATDGTGESYATGETFTIADSDITFYAQWTQNPTYTITYMPNGATGVAPVDNNRYEEGQQTTLKSTGDLSRYRYDFSGWNSEQDGSGDMYAGGETITIPGRDITLYAMWTPVATFTVTYHANGASGEAPVNTLDYESGDRVTLPGQENLIREGYSFVGWSADASGNGVTYVPGASVAIQGSDLDMYAIWTQNPTYSVAYYANGGAGTSPIDNTAYEEGMSVSISGAPNLERTGHTFAGWNTKSDGSGDSYSPGDSYTMPAADASFYAVWTINTYTVTFNSNGGSPVGSQNITYNQTLSEPAAPTRDGYQFAGWHTSSQLTTAFDFSTLITADRTLHAKWTPVYTITYHANGATGSVPEDNGSYASGATVTVMNKNTLSKADYSFSGWNTSADGTGLSRTSGGTFQIGSANVNLYAQWTPDAPAITSDPDAVTVLAGQSATFTVTASGAELSYQWQKDGVDISGATSASYSISAARFADAGLYRCVVSNPTDNAASGAGELAVNPPGMKMINAQGLTFTMGDNSGNADERPEHEVSFTYNFWMDSTEVTQADFEALMGYNPSDFVESTHPANNIRWLEAAMYCNERSKRDGLDTVYSYSSMLYGFEGGGCPQFTGFEVDISANGYRLPTEAEWEFSCRAGTTSRTYWSWEPGGTADYAWYAGNSNASVHPVAQKLPNQFGLYDMIGNVYEYCNDWMGSYSSEAQTDPTGPTGVYDDDPLNGGDSKVLRGCSYAFTEDNLSATYRIGDLVCYAPDNSYGFRVALPAQ
jgi:uncharacterized repeat protein (TIGR02543 family)